MNEEVILNCMGAKKDEKILIIFDKNKTKIADSIFNKAKELNLNVRKIETSVGKENGEEPPEEITKEMLNYDILLLITTKSLSHTKARRDASEKGARIASMPNMTEDIMSRLDINYKKMIEASEKIADIMTKGNEVRLITKKGTDILIDIKGSKGTIDSGMYIKKKDFGNLPAGEVAILPRNANGIFVVDATFAGIGELDKPIKITVKNNYAVKIENGESAKKLLKIVNQFGKEARNIAELGIGMNDKAKITGITLEDEKVLGTAHIALGNNKSYGGNIDVPLHLDGVFYNPTIFVDEQKIMDKGRLLI